MIEQIRAVTFDVGNTLIEPRVSIGQTYSDFAARHGFPGLSPHELELRFRAEFSAHGGLVSTREDWRQIVDRTFEGLIARTPSETFFPELFDHFKQPAAWRIYDDVFPTLDALSARGLRLGIISNWDERLRPLLCALGLALRFEVIAVSCEAGFAKPARQIFDSAVRSFNLPANAILHVGDDFEADVRGARAAGLQAAQISRTKPQAQDCLTSLRQVIACCGGS